MNARLKSIAGIDFFDLDLSIVIAVKRWIHVEKMRAVELHVSEKG
jgi:hypothetical protein